MRDPDYLAWLRDRRCVACALADPGPDARLRVIDAAHGPVNGTGSKGPDSGAIPLCRPHHTHQHGIGWPAFEQKYGFNREREAAAHYAVYLIDQESRV